MAGFTELIKNFDKIRDYARDFLVYGYKCRGDYTRKSSRSYDNERRRIESYLARYVKWETSARGKNLFINTSTADLSENPLFSLWETKSFTSNDCLLHFFLFAILLKLPGLTFQEVSDTLYDHCLSCFDNPPSPDPMTIRNKLNEYVDAGLFSKQKKGKALHYYISDDPFNQAFPNIINRLITPLHYFENITPAGVLGYFILRDYGQHHSPFSFRHLFTSHTLEDEVLISILTAIQEKKMIQYESYSNRLRNSFRQTSLPLRVAINVKHGRQYLLAYNKRKNTFFSFRLDYIKNVHILEKIPDFDQRLTELEAKFSPTWGISLGRRNQLEQLEMVISINESTEAFVLTRLKREGKHGTIEKVADNTFVYRIEVTDTQEMVPWLRTFIGRIVSIKGSNQWVINQFTADIMRMAAMYEE